jgi:hypothetical protein
MKNRGIAGASSSIRRSWRRRRCALLALLVAVAPGTAFGATFTVTNTDDTGAGSLRQAITDANANDDVDDIVFESGVTGTITLTSGNLAINESVNIVGPGATTLAVSGDNEGVFYIYNGTALIDVTISGLTIQDGTAPLGGCILDRFESLELDGVVVKDCGSTGDGGGILVDGEAPRIRCSH